MNKVFGVIVAVLMAVPLIWFYVAMYWGFSISKDIAEFQRGETVAVPVFPPMKWLNDRAEVKNVFSSEEITSGRFVTTRIEVPFETLLLPGETPPVNAMKELYASLRAPKAVMPLCDEILGSLASACALGGFEAKVYLPGDRGAYTLSRSVPESGLAVLEGTLRYLPAYEMGNPAIVPNGDILAVSQRLLEGERIEDTVEGRRDAFAEALLLCNALQDKFGNCVIRSISLEPDRVRANRDAGTPVLRAMATFKVMVDKTVYRRANVQTALSEIVESRVAAVESSQ